MTDEEIKLREELIEMTKDLAGQGILFPMIQQDGVTVEWIVSMAGGENSVGNSDCSFTWLELLDIYRDQQK